jgi:hypothetical protein
MKHTSLTIIASSALAVVLAVGPAAAFAKGEANLHGRAEAQASTTMNKSCVKALGHLVAPGWIAAHGTTTVSTNCKLPFGLAVKLGLAHKIEKHKQGTTTPDTLAPTISYIASRADRTSATVTWYTNERATTQLAYGTTSAYGSTTALVTKLGFLHSVKITGLSPATTYHFKVMSRDASGNLSVSSDSTLTTRTAADATSPTISAISVSGIGATTATVNWTTNEPAKSKVYFASGSSLNVNTASSVTNNALVTNHVMTLSGLSASTTYSYAVKSQDASGNSSISGTGSFITSL